MRLKPPTLSWPLLTAAAVLTVGGLLLASCGDDDDDGSVSPDRPSAAFSWDGNDLYEWVTEDELADALADVLTADTGADLDGGALDRLPGDEYWTWEFRLPGEAESWAIIAHDGDHDGKYEGPPTDTDSRLPEGVTYEAGGGFAHGFYVLSGPKSDESICMALFPPGTSFGYPGETDVGVHEDRLFAIASVMVQELGWTEEYR